MSCYSFFFFQEFSFWFFDKIYLFPAIIIAGCDFVVVKEERMLKYDLFLLSV